MTLSIGYTLSSEEQTAPALVEQAEAAENAGFDFAVIADHFHPWVDAQGQSPFVWSVLGGIAAKTSRIRVGTGVTCPTIRIHPAIIAQAVATTASLMPGRFFLGVGSGENLNEHVVGANWPSVAVRQEMLEEAVELIRKLWSGSLVDHHGQHYTVEGARIYSLPDELPPIYIAASGMQAAELAASAGDGLITTSPDQNLVAKFKQSGNNGARIGQLTVCYSKSEAEAEKTAHHYWPNAALKGAFKMELPLPSHFEEAASTVRTEDVAKLILCGPDVDRHVSRIQEFAEAGFDHVYVHQVGPDQEGFMKFYQDEVMPRLR